MLKASVLAIGDELLNGQVINSNAAWISRKLTHAGFATNLQLVVSDDERAIIEGFELCCERSDTIILTGGLGPTSDDLTVEVLARHLNRKQVFDAQWFEIMREYFRSRGREMPENNRKQALIPEGAHRIDNDCGTAPGLWITHGKKQVAVLPGVPYEMQSMMMRFVLPRLEKQAVSGRIYERTVLTSGIGESVLADRLGDLSAMLSERVKIAFLPSPLGVRVRINGFGSNPEEARALAQPLEQKILSSLGKYIYGFDDEPFEDALGRLLRERNLTIATAESCTGGLIGHRLTNAAGSSAYFRGGVIAYDNSVKTSELGVPPELIRRVGAVSEDVAQAMAEGVRSKFGTDIGVAATGIAGPGGGSVEKPVGLVWIAVSDARGTVTQRFIFEKDRLRNKERSAQAALNMIRVRLIDERP